MSQDKAWTSDKLRATALHTLLERGQEAGWLRPIDCAMARFVQETTADSEALTAFSAALVSAQLGCGHSCLDLEQALADPDSLGAGNNDPSDQHMLGSDADEEADYNPAIWLNGLTLSDWLACLRDSEAVAQARENNDDEATPLVLDGQRLYLRRYWRYERQITDALATRVKPPQSQSPALRQRLDALFPKPEDPNEIDWQKVAAAQALCSDFCVISGGPGTGKTTTVVKLLALLQQRQTERKDPPLRIRLAAPTGKAAARLTESIGSAIDGLPVGDEVKSAIPRDVTTLHRLLGARPDTRRFRHHAGNPLHLDLLVVDEASMVDLELMAALLQALPPKAGLILLGDKDQLASVEAGAVLGDLCAHADLARTGFNEDTLQLLAQLTGLPLPQDKPIGPLGNHIALLRRSYRFGADSGIGRLAFAVNRGDTVTVREVWNHGYTDIQHIQLRDEQDRALSRLAVQGYRPYLKLVQAGPTASITKDDVEQWAKEVLNTFADFQLLCALRRGPWGVEGLNRQIAQALRTSKLIEREEGWYAGRPVLMTHNDYSLGLMNGDIGMTLPDRDAGNALRVFFQQPDGRLKRVLPSRLNDVDTVYAMTVHKSQGSEFTHAALAFPDRDTPVLTRELYYTAITRAREQFTLFTAKSALQLAAVERKTQRYSGLRERLWGGN